MRGIEFYSNRFPFLLEFFSYPYLPEIEGPDFMVLVMIMTYGVIFFLIMGQVTPMMDSIINLTTSKYLINGHLWLVLENEGGWKEPF
ncbi:MAG: hypothetical protein ABJF04_21700 [Reichenbachiella sp.]|uniref:hypothetical protein n=1 Tax=Reichenbachiella sp. TaxID=2184521 RepID=UPI003267D2E6